MTDDLQQAPGRAAARVLQLLEFLGRRSRPVPAGIIYAECGIPRSTVYNILKVLGQKGFATYDESSRGWSIGPKINELQTLEPSLSQALMVLRAFESSAQVLTLDQVASESGLGRDLAGSVAMSLCQYGLLRLRDDGAYTLGLELVALSSRVGWADRLRMLARPHLVRLRDATGETANLILVDEDHAIYIDQVESRHALRHSGWVGRRIPLEGTAAGHALADPSRAHAVSDAVEPGVTAIASAVEGTAPPTAVGITAPTWRLENIGLAKARSMVHGVARDVTARMTQ